MRKLHTVGLILFVALACEIPTGAASTLVAEGQQVASKVAQALTETYVAESGGAPAETPPSGGMPETTPTVDSGPAATATLEPTAALPHLRVAFISGGSPWLVAPPAPAYQLSAQTGVDSVDLSDDGMMVAYVRHNTYSEPAELRVVNYDGTGDRSLLTSAQVGSLEPLPGGATWIDLFRVIWIPGTHNLLINTKVQYEGPGLQRSDDLFMINAETGAMTTIFTAGNAGEVYPSPDGTKLAISRATFIAMSNIDGTGVVTGIITFPAIITYSEFMYYPEAVWAADSSRFGVIIASADPMAPNPTGAIWIVNASTGAGTLQSTLNGNFYLQGVLSPTLDRVGYTVGSGPVDSYVSALDGSSALHLGTGTTAVVSFSPDGQYFCYYVGSPSTRYIGSLGGGTVLVPGGAMFLMWYNNTSFVYASGTYAAWTLKMGDIYGASSVIATPSGDRVTFDVDE